MEEDEKEFPRTFEYPPESTRLTASEYSRHVHTALFDLPFPTKRILLLGHRYLVCVGGSVMEGPLLKPGVHSDVTPTVAKLVDLKQARPWAVWRGDDLVCVKGSKHEAYVSAVVQGHKDRKAKVKPCPRNRLRVSTVSLILKKTEILADAFLMEAMSLRAIRTNILYKSICPCFVEQFESARTFTLGGHLIERVHTPLLKVLGQIRF